MMKKTTLILAICIAIGAAACSGDTVDTKDDTAADDTVTTEEPTTTTASSGGEAASTYFQAIASSSPVDDQEALDASKEGSTARDYAVMQTAMARARAGSFDQDSTVEVDGDEIRLCYTGGTAEDCNVFSDIEVDGNKVTDFVVNGEDPRTRLSIGGNPVSIAGITYTPIGAYVGSKTNQLYIAYEATNGTASTFQLETFGESYVDSTGQQFSVADSSGPSSPIQPGATAIALATFDGPTLGGQLGVNGFIDDANFSDAPATLEISTPAV